MERFFLRARVFRTTPLEFGKRQQKHRRYRARVASPAAPLGVAREIAACREPAEQQSYVVQRNCESLGGVDCVAGSTGVCVTC